MPDNRLQVPIITFGGLDADAGDLTLEGNRTDSLRNVLLSSHGRLTKRAGMAWIANDLDSSCPLGAQQTDGCNIVLASTAMQTAFGSSNNYVYMFAQNGDVSSMCYFLDTETPVTWTTVPTPLNFSATRASSCASTFVDERKTPDDSTNWVYYSDAMYVTSKDTEPFILIFGPAGPYSTPVAPTGTYSVDGSDRVILTFSGSAVRDGWVVTPQLQNHTGSAFYTNLHQRNFHLESTAGAGVASTTFYLIYSYGTNHRGITYNRKTISGSPAAIDVTNSQYFSLDTYSTAKYGSIRWPRGVYDAASGVRGYPKRWDDVEGDGDWTDAGFPRGTPDWPAGFTVIGESLESRGYAWGFIKDPQRVDFSELGVPYNFLRTNVLQAEDGVNDEPGVDGGYFYADRGDGDPVVAVRKFQDYLVVFKYRKTMLYRGTPGSLDDPLYLVKSVPVGAVSEAAIVEVGNEIFFWSQDGPRTLSAVTEYGDIMTTGIGKRIRSLLPLLNLNQMDKVVGRHNKVSGFVAWHVPYGSATKNNFAAVYFYDFDEWTLFDGIAANISAQATVTLPWKSEELTFASINEFITTATSTYKSIITVLDSDVHDAQEWTGSALEDTAIEADYTTRWYSAGDASLVKTLFGADALVGADGAPGAIKYSTDFDPSSTSAEVLESIDNDTNSRSIERLGFSGNCRVFRCQIIDNTTSGFTLMGLVPKLEARSDR